MSEWLRPALSSVRSAGAHRCRSRPPNWRVRDMRLATISSSASARFQDRATSCRRYVRDDRMNRNRYNCRCAQEVSSPHPFARKRFFSAAARHPAVLVYPPRAGAAESRESSATRVVRAREMNSANRQRTRFGSEIPTTGNGRALPTRRDQELNHQSRRPLAVCPAPVGKSPKGRFSNGKCESGETSMNDLRGINGRDD